MFALTHGPVEVAEEPASAVVQGKIANLDHRRAAGRSARPAGGCLGRVGRLVRGGGKRHEARPSLFVQPDGARDAFGPLVRMVARHQNGQPTLGERLQDVLQFRALRRIQPRRRVVQDEEFRILRERPRQEHPPRFAVGKGNERTLPKLAHVRQANKPRQALLEGTLGFRRFRPDFVGIDAVDFFIGEEIRDGLAAFLIVTRLRPAGRLGEAGVRGETQKRGGIRPLVRLRQPAAPIGPHVRVRSRNRAHFARGRQKI